MALIDFTNCETDYTANYGGSDRKRGIIYNGKKYMVKFSDRIPEEKRNSLNSSYTNSYLSEYIGCHVMESLDLKVQNTLLGSMKFTSSSGEEILYPVVACENFISKEEYLIEFKYIEGALLEKRPPRVPMLSDIYKIFTEENQYFSKEFGKKALAAYWDLFIADALLGNFDRHANNWGYLYNENKNEITLAPIYDCGSCLYPQIADEAISMILENEEEIQKRIDVFPKAALEFDNGEKIGYRSFIASFENPDCTAALLRIAPKVNLRKIENIINNIDDISSIRKKLYITMIGERYRKIILEPYQKLMQKQQIYYNRRI